MSLDEISQAVIKAFTVLFNDVADYPVPWDILIGLFAAIFFYYLFNLLIPPSKGSRPGL